MKQLDRNGASPTLLPPVSWELVEVDAALRSGRSSVVPVAEPVFVVTVDGAHGSLAEKIVGELEGAGIAVQIVDSEPGVLVKGIERTRPGVVVLAVDDADEEILGVIDAIRSTDRPPAIVGVVPPTEVLAAGFLLAAGVFGCVSRDELGKELVDAVRWAGKGGAWVSPHLLAALLSGRYEPAEPTTETARLSCLTSREREVLSLMAEGLSKPAIARRLTLSVNTVRTHAQSIMRKLEVHSSTGAVSYGLIAARTPAGIAKPDDRRRAIERLFGALPPRSDNGPIGWTTT